MRMKDPAIAGAPGWCARSRRDASKLLRRQSASRWIVAALSSAYVPDDTRLGPGPTDGVRRIRVRWAGV